MYTVTRGGGNNVAYYGPPPFQGHAHCVNVTGKGPSNVRGLAQGRGAARGGSRHLRDSFGVVYREDGAGGGDGGIHYRGDPKRVQLAGRHNGAAWHTPRVGSGPGPRIDQCLAKG